MSQNLEGKETSLWVATTERTSYPALASGSRECDAVVVGGGITGIITAYRLQQAGLKVILVEKSRIVEWTTGSTTAKLTSQHYLTYDYLIQKHGKEAAQAFADANQDGINEIEALSEELHIDCEFMREDAYVYTQSTDKVADMKAEVAAAQELGLPASFETEVRLPVEAVGAVKFTSQAQFHPRKFLLGVADEFIKNGGEIFENTKAKDITHSEEGCVVTTDKGDLKARHVVQASGEPFWGGDIFDGFMWTKMSYALGVTLHDESQYPKNMYITTDEPMRTIRSAEYEGKPILVFGGESHELDPKNFDSTTHYQNLINDVHEKYTVDKVMFRWLAGDAMPYDRMPYIGPLPDQNNIFVATGYRAWGLAWAMSAARVIVGDITGNPVVWAQHFRLDRLSRPLAESEKEHVL